MFSKGGLAPTVSLFASPTNRGRATPPMFSPTRAPFPSMLVKESQPAPMSPSTLDGSPMCQERKGTNVYVSNLPASMTSSKFRQLFSPFGTIIGARLVKRRKGDAPVGFVQYTMAGMAQAAINSMDGRVIDGVKVSTRLANRDKDKGIDNKPSSNLYVANLPQKVTEQDLRMIFSRYGDIHSLRVLKYPNTGVSKGTALVRFVSMEDATRAKEALHCLPLQGQDLPLEVKYAETKEEKVTRRNDRAQAEKPAQAREDGCGDDIAANVAAVTEEDEEDEEEEEGPWSPSMRPPLFTPQVDVPACDLMAAQWNSSTFMTPINQLGGRPEPHETNTEAMKALADYMKFMSGGKPEAEYTENNSWNSQSSSILSMGHTNDSLTHSFDEGSTTTPPEMLDYRRPPLRRQAAPFVPAPPAPEPWNSGAPVDQGTTDSVMVEGLPSGMDKLALYELFGPLGAVLKLESVLNADNRTRTAIVKFRECGEATLAHSKLHGIMFKGNLLKVKMF